MLTVLQPPASAAPSKAASTATAAGSGAPPPPVHALGLTADDELFVAVLEPTDNQRPGRAVSVTAASTHTLRVPGGAPAFLAGVVTTLDRTLVALLDASRRSLLVHTVGSSQLQTLPLPQMGPQAVATLAPHALPGLVVVSDSDGSSHLLKLPAAGSKGALSSVRHVEAAEGAAHLFSSTASREGKAVIALTSLAPAGAASAGAVSSLQLEVMQVEADGALGEWSAPEALPFDGVQHGAPTAAWLNSYARKDGSLGHRLLLTSSDHAVQLLQAAKDGAGSVGWVRHEALAAISHSEMIEMPALATDADEDAPRPFFGFALPAIVDSVSRRWAEAVAGPATTAAGSGAEAGPPPTHADSYGLRQMVVATTQAGSVYGIHSVDGSVVWSRRIPPPTPGDAPPTLPHLYVCRGGGAPHAIVVAQSPSAWRVHELSPFTGKLIAAPDAPSGAGEIVHASRLTSFAAADGSTRPPVLLVERLPPTATGAPAEMRVHIHPSTPEHRAALRARLGDMFFFLSSPDNGALAGYMVALADAAAPAGSERFVATPTWKMALPPASAAVDGRAPVTFASFSPDAAVHSPVRVLGDRSVLHKYINRNLLAVGIESPADGMDDASLQVMLVDTVSGRVVHHVRHENARGPLTMLLGENWLAWHFWSTTQNLYHMAVAELFTNTTVADDPVSLILTGGPDYALRDNGFDAFTQPPPHVLAQAYAYAASIEAMGVTQTVAGITPKFVLVLTSAGQLVLLDKRFLDPRRPIVPGGPQKMSQVDREEGLVPYSPSLGGIPPLTVATHKHTLARPRQVQCSPTGLESTCLAFVTGLDLFLTRVAPAREFDRLNEDFNYIALVGATIGLTVATLFTGWYSDRRDLSRAWK